MNAPDDVGSIFTLYIGGFKMSNLLLKKYKDYIHLKNCRAEYNLSNGMAIDFVLL